MKIHLIAIGDRMPAWVSEGFARYQRRLPAGSALVLREITAPKRGKNADVARIRRDEGERMLAAIPSGSEIIALDVGGRMLSTPQLAERFGGWLADGRDRSLLIGGPEGLADEVLARAAWRWSLSPLTFPHPLTRVLVAEQLYRAWSILNRHPYHRE